jgi:transcriptional regulator with XRE-family HTH domain
MIITEMSTLERLEDYEIRSEYGSETLKYDIAAALVAARKMKNLTQTALANIAGVSQAYIAKLESGEANPTIGRIGAILGSIWLKAEINLISLATSLENEAAKQTKHPLEVKTTIPSNAFTEVERWLGLQAQVIGQQSNKMPPYNKETRAGSVIYGASLRIIQQSSAITSRMSHIVMQQLIPASENVINPSETGALDMHKQLTA